MTNKGFTGDIHFHPPWLIWVTPPLLQSWLETTINSRANQVLMSPPHGCLKMGHWIQLWWLIHHQNHVAQYLWQFYAIFQGTIQPFLNQPIFAWSPKLLQERHHSGLGRTARFMEQWNRHEIAGCFEMTGDLTVGYWTRPSRNIEFSRFLMEKIVIFHSCVRLPEG